MRNIALTAVMYAVLIQVGVTESSPTISVEQILDLGRNNANVSKLRKIKRQVMRDRAKNKAADMALAKIGDKAAQMRLSCALVRGQPRTQAETIADLEYVGGWFAVSALSQRLDENEANNRQLFEGDAVFGSSKELAVKTLARMFPEAKINNPSNPAAVEELRAATKEWRLWLENQGVRLKQLEPQRVVVCPYSEK